jgi:hypothetical protein
LPRSSQDAAITTDEEDDKEEEPSIEDHVGGDDIKP